MSQSVHHAAFQPAYSCLFTARGHEWHSVTEALAFARGLLGGTPVATQPSDLPGNRPFKRSWWDQVKRDTRLRFEVEKFIQNGRLHELLVGTGSAAFPEDSLEPSDVAHGSDTPGVLENVREILRGQVEHLPTTLVIGDSILRGMSEPWLSRLSGHRVRVISLPGARLNTIFSVASLVCGRQYARVVIFGGTNNLAYRDGRPATDPQTLFESTQRLVAQLKSQIQLDSTQITIAHLLNRPGRGQGPWEQIVDQNVTQYNALLDQAQRLTLFELGVDVISIPPLPRHQFWDGLHPTSEGLRRLTMELGAAL